jgi:hypothetical protein
VARVGDEAPLAHDCVVEAVEHRVEGLAEPADLVAGGRHRKPCVRVPIGDRRGTRPHPLDRPQRCCYRRVGRERRERERDQPAEHQRRAQRGDLVVEVVERAGRHRHAAVAGALRGEL